MTPDEIARLDFAKGGGMIPAIVQHAVSGAVLMLGYMTREALEETLARKRVVFFSRSTQRLWEKGETSGHSLDLEAVHADCDADTLLIIARPRGPACHLNTATCFGEAALTQAGPLAFLASLESIIGDRMSRPSGSSYTAKLYAQGPRRMAQKVGEEGVEFALAAACESGEHVISEAADLVFHLLVSLRSRGVTMHDVLKELESRHTLRSAPEPTE